MTRAQLAADVLGNAHALDNGQPTATLVLATLQHMASEDTAAQALPMHAASGTSAEPAVLANAAEFSASDNPRPAERTRDVWARAGVLVNELARPALYLNLPAGPQALPFGTAGEPGYLSLRQLLRTPPDWTVAGQDLYVCENPNIVSICTDGMPAAAQRMLLQQLADAGAQLRYHGDFDWAGIAIANCVFQPIVDGISG